MFKKGYKQTDEHKKKIGLSNLGKKRSSLFIENIRNRMKGKTLPISTRNKMSNSAKGKHYHLSGKNLSNEHRKKIADSLKGAKSHFWKGGITNLNRIIRGSTEYKLWRESVFKRDNYTCIWCGDSKSGNLNADHIKPFAFYPELRFAIDNGRTLCIDCHKTTDTYLTNKKK